MDKHNDNYAFSWYFYDMFRDMIYKDSRGKLYVKHMNNIFSDDGNYGQYKNIKNILTELSIEELNNLKDFGESSQSYENFEPKFNAKHVFDFTDLVSNSAFKKSLNLTKSSLIREIQSPKINLVKYKNKEKVLLLTSEFGVESVLDVIEEVYVTLSKLGLTPFVYEHGQFDINGVQYLYLITDYVPLTLGEIKGSELKNDLLKRALVIAYSIHGMGYYNQDLHDENFLYDEITDKLYEIDFTDIEIGDFPEIKLTPTINLEDINRRVTAKEILDGIY